MDSLIPNTFEVRDAQDMWIVRGTYEECVNMLKCFQNDKRLKQSSIKKFYIVRIP